VTQTSDIQTTVEWCIEELNKQLPSTGQLEKSPETVLVGEGGLLDSLGLITLFVSIEQELATRHGLTCALVDLLMSETKTNPLHTIADTVQWISQSTAKTE
jgi:acyl carrier protein